MKKIILLILFPLFCLSQSDEIIHGTWEVIELEYSAEVYGFPFSGNSYDAGTWNFNNIDYSYAQNLDFQSEPFTIPIPLNPIEIPSLPIQSSTNGTWSLTSNNENLIITDNITSVESTYDIILLTDNVMILSGILPYAQDFMGIELDLDMELGMTLVKQANTELISNTNSQKNILKKVDLLGRANNQKSAYIIIYEDGTSEKYLKFR